jgi:hypothetical protein
LCFAFFTFVFKVFISLSVTPTLWRLEFGFPFLLFFVGATPARSSSICLFGLLAFHDSFRILASLRIAFLLALRIVPHQWHVLSLKFGVLSTIDVME